jgi:hypothetical protein
VQSTEVGQKRWEGRREGKCGKKVKRGKIVIFRPRNSMSTCRISCP